MSPQPLHRADARYQKQWRVDRARGIKRLVSASAATEHVRALAAAGCSARSIAETSGTSASTITGLLSGRYPTIQRGTEKAVLAVTLAAILGRYRPAGFVPAIGARRRIQALMAMGWRHQDITAAMRRHGTRQPSAVLLHQDGRYIAKSSADAIAATYDDLWCKPGPSALTRRRAAILGYAGPLDWDDDSIDDPAATPHAPAATQDDREHLVEDVEFLLSSGTTTDTASQRLGRTWPTIERTLYRAGRGDLVARLKGSDVA